jgi:hypothetical protein
MFIHKYSTSWYNVCVFSVGWIHSVFVKDGHVTDDRFGIHTVDFQSNLWKTVICLKWIILIEIYIPHTFCQTCLLKASGEFGLTLAEGGLWHFFIMFPFQRNSCSVYWQRTNNIYFVCTKQGDVFCNWTVHLLFYKCD